MKCQDELSQKNLQRHARYPQVQHTIPPPKADNEVITTNDVQNEHNNKEHFNTELTPALLCVNRDAGLQRKENLFVERAPE